MGHVVGKDVYRQLGRKIDGLTMRAPWSESLYAILKELYSEDDAALIVKMPFGPARLERLERLTGLPQATLLQQLDSLCHRGLVMDIDVGDRYYYMPSPMVIGVFEFTMMRTGGDLDHKKLAELFNDYLQEGPFMAANLGRNLKVPLMRALPHEGSIDPEDYVEVLDYEKATTLIESTPRWAMGLCSCRHEKRHLGENDCKAPIDNCSTLGANSVDFMVRNGLAREVSKTEMLENVARSRELGLGLNADNVRRNVSFICHCCGCCCNLLQGFTRWGYTTSVKTSAFIAKAQYDICSGCKLCSQSCPVGAITRAVDTNPRFRKYGRPQIDEALCIGCGVCAVKCRLGAMTLHKREQRVFYPEDVFERIILQCLERGTLQNQLFNNPQSKTQAFMRSMVGAFFRLPFIKQALMSELLRSRFLTAVRGIAGYH